jgi:hypothetical protein
MTLPFVEPAPQAGNMVSLLSSPEGSTSWAAGMRDEIQVSTEERDFDRAYVSHCLSLLRRTGGWRLLRNARGAPFRSFIQFCYARRPYGLALTRAEMVTVLLD